MWNRLLLLMMLLSLFSCSGKNRQRVCSIRNHTSTVIHIPYVYEDPSEFLRIRRHKSLIITDANGFTVPYQKIDSNKVIFMLNVPAGEGKKYTFQATDLQLDFPSALTYERTKSGDIYWGNGKTTFFARSYNSNNVGAGIGYAPNGEGDMSYVFDNTLGCGAVAPYSDGHLVRYGDFVKMELLDSGPVLLRMRLTYPDFQLEGRTVHEERTISTAPNIYYSKVESRFIGIDKLQIAVCIACKDGAGYPADSSANFNTRFNPIFEPGKGYMCYAEEGTTEKNGTIFTSVVVKDRSRNKNMIVDGHMAMVSEIENGEPFVYYVGASTSFTGMNYRMWETLVQSNANQFRNSMQINSYDVE